MWFVSTNLTEDEQRALEEGNILKKGYFEDFFPSEETIQRRRRFWRLVVQTLHFFSVLVVLGVLAINGFFLICHTVGAENHILRCYNIVFCLIAALRELEVPCTVRYFRALGWPFSKFIFYTLIGFLSIEDDVMDTAGWIFWLQVGALLGMDLCAFLFLLVGICCAHNVRFALQTEDDKALPPSEKDDKSESASLKANSSFSYNAIVPSTSTGNLSWIQDADAPPLPPPDVHTTADRIHDTPHIPAWSQEDSDDDNSSRPSWLSESNQFQ
mmetsp:Transcript_823/g.1225  ORF Transcript_823/g.1225 Transcript_823/m.1225 type:complete len:270 (+) Transcript_823:104-913(+)